MPHKHWQRKPEQTIEIMYVYITKHSSRLKQSATQMQVKQLLDFRAESHFLAGSD